jgi:hypothetical protein
LSLKKKSEIKIMDDQYIRSIGRLLVSKEDAFLWLSRGDMKAETESEIITTQDQVLRTTYRAQIVTTE